MFNNYLVCDHDGHDIEKSSCFYFAHCEWLLGNLQFYVASK